MFDRLLLFCVAGVLTAATGACTKQQNPRACPNTPCETGFVCIREGAVARCVAQDGGVRDDGGNALNDAASMGSVPGPPARSLVPGGTRAASRSYFVVKTLSATPGRSTVSTSKTYRAVGGVAGSSQK